METPTAPSPTVVERMRSDLPTAMKARDQAAVVALRTGLAAIANAEAPPAVPPPAAPASGAPTSEAVEPVVGRLVEHARLELSADDIDRILRHEIADRRDTIESIRSRGRVDAADELQAEIDVLERYVS